MVVPGTRHSTSARTVTFVASNSIPMQAMGADFGGDVRPTLHPDFGPLQHDIPYPVPAHALTMLRAVVIWGWA